MRGRTFLIWLFGITIGMNTLCLSGVHSSEGPAKCVKKINIVRIRTSTKAPERTCGTINLENINLENIDLENINDEPDTFEPEFPLIVHGPRQYCSDPIGLLYTNGDIYPVPEQDIPSGKQKAVGIIFPNCIIHPIVNDSVSNTQKRTPIGVVCKNKDNIYPLPKWPPCLECEPLGVMYPDGIILKMPSRLSSSNNELVAILNSDGTVTSVDQTELGPIPDIDEKYYILQYIFGVDGITNGAENPNKAATLSEYLLTKQQLNKETENQSKASENVIIAAQKVTDATAALQAAENLRRRSKQKFEISPREQTVVAEQVKAAQLAQSKAVVVLAKSTAALKSAEKKVKASKKKIKLSSQEKKMARKTVIALQVPQSSPEEILAKARAALQAAEKLLNVGESKPGTATAGESKPGSTTAKPGPMTSKEAKEQEKAAKEAEKAAKEEKKANKPSSKEADKPSSKEADKPSSKEAKSGTVAPKQAVAEENPNDMEAKLAEARAALLLAEEMVRQSQNN